MTATPSAPQDAAYLQKIAQEIEATAKWAEEGLGPLPADQLNRRPAPDKWSAAECLQHLIITNRLYLPQLEAIVAGQYDPAPWHRLHGVGRYMGRYMLRYIDPHSTKPLPAPKIFLPSTSSLSPDVVLEFVQQQREVVLPLVERMQGIDLDRTMVHSPASSLLFYPLRDTLRMLYLHNARHLLQAQRAVLA